MKGKVPIKKKNSTKTQQLGLKITEIVFLFVATSSSRDA